GFRHALDQPPGGDGFRHQAGRGRTGRGAAEPCRAGSLPGRHRRRSAGVRCGRAGGRERTMSQQPILDVRGLSARYGKVGALSDATLSVAAGSIVTVIGANGAGKSTLLNAMMGALPTSGHASGAVCYAGADVSGWPVERRVAAGMSLVPERRELFGSMSVEDNLLLGGF